jgi:hypothetical protein
MNEHPIMWIVLAILIVQLIDVGFQCWTWLYPRNR